MSCGRDGAEPIVIDLPTPREQADRIAELMASAHNEGHAWLPHKVRKGTHDFDPLASR